jgi:hypothetical protein
MTHTPPQPLPLLRIPTIITKPTFPISPSWDEVDLCCQSWIGYYQVYLGRDITNTSNILTHGNGRFDNETEAIFTVSEKDTLSSITAVIIHLKTDYLPHEIGFSICNDGTNFEYGPGTFSGLANHDIVSTFSYNKGLFVNVKNADCIF